MMSYIASRKIFNIYQNATGSSRNFWAWLNIMFNLVDKKRIKEVGADRACAEWLLRNGGQVTFAGEEPTKNYNAIANLPASLRKQLIEIDASEASITHHGFGHLHGCNHVQSMKFHKNEYLNDNAVADLKIVGNSLRKLHISNCEEVTDKGVISITQLSKLSELTLFGLGVTDWKKCETELRNILPSCILRLNEQHQ